MWHLRDTPTARYAHHASHIRPEVKVQGVCHVLKWVGHVVKWVCLVTCQLQKGPLQRVELGRFFHQEKLDRKL